ncbi:hypothetical protein GCM10011366_07010 [Ornithinimicrobium tianjinense]|uniref:Uncharacterized protein n=1 Tax=Ornithinimicrobium tianjinense TaxID=1195761 RepID=A0A917BHW5_9MICO|nr:hypothetical protein GCM10011366_07010 [Ornithinimicrobium tianjinense]
MALRHTGPVPRRVGDQASAPQAEAHRERLTDGADDFSGDQSGSYMRGIGPIGGTSTKW